MSVNSANPANINSNSAKSIATSTATNNIKTKQALQHVASSSSIVIEDKNDVEQVKRFALAVCREYLGGAWTNVDPDDFVIKRIS